MYYVTPQDKCNVYLSIFGIAGTLH